MERKNHPTSPPPSPPVGCGPFFDIQIPEEDDSDTESAAVHRSDAVLYFHLAALIDDSDSENKVKLLKNATASAEESLAICPDQIGVILIYNLALFYLAEGQEDYERIVNQCRQALLIQELIRPKNDFSPNQKETVTEDSSTKEARIRAVKKKLKRLMQKAKRALYREEKSKEEAAEEEEEGEEENSEFVLSKQKLEHIVNTRKSQESTRKKIEVNVATVADWEKQFYLGSVKFPDSDSPKKDEKKGSAYSKKANKSLIVPQLNRQTQVADYWRRMSGKERSRFLVVNVDEMMEHYSNNEYAISFFNEAINFGKMCQKWKCWRFPGSNVSQFFLDYDSWINHVFRVRNAVFLLGENVIMPSPVDPVCASKIENGAWKPVDVNMLLKENKMDTDEDKWPLCKDIMREKLLQRIKELLKLLLRNRCLSQSIVDSLIRSTRHNLETSVSELHNLIPGLDENPLCICFLGSQQLRAMLEWLLHMSYCCQLSVSSEDGGFYNEVNEAEEYRETITFTNDLSVLALDQRLLQGEIESQNDASFVHWLYTGDEIDELLNTWAFLRFYKLEKANEAFQYLNSEYRHLQSLFWVKRFWLRYEKALAAFQDIFHAEDIKRLDPGYNPQSYWSLLPSSQDEIAGVARIDRALDGRNIGLNYILNYLKNLKLRCFEISGAAETLVQSHAELSYLKTGEENRQSRIAAAEAYLRTSIRDKEFYVSKQKCTVDALIMNSLAAGAMDRKFGLLSAHDYLPIMLHFLKSFVRAQLEEEAADAAKDSLLSELALALPPSKSSAKEACSSRKEGKNKKNKKKKDKRKTKEKAHLKEDVAHAAKDSLLSELAVPPSNISAKEDRNSRREGKNAEKQKREDKEEIKEKTTVGSKKHQLHIKKENTESSLPTKLAGPSSDSGITGQSKGNKEEEQRGQFVYEQVELQLEKSLDHQRQLEDEAKKKQLAEAPQQFQVATRSGDASHASSIDMLLYKSRASDYESGNLELDDTCNISGGTNVANEEDEATLESSGEVVLPEIDIFHTFCDDAALESPGEVVLPEIDVFHTFGDDAELESPGEVVLPEIDIFHTFCDDATLESSGEVVLPDIDIFYTFCDDAKER